MLASGGSLWLIREGVDMQFEPPESEELGFTGQLELPEELESMLSLRVTRDASGHPSKLCSASIDFLRHDAAPAVCKPSYFLP